MLRHRSTPFVCPGAAPSPVPSAAGGRPKLLPLGALAAGFGLFSAGGWAQQQTAPAAAAPRPAASAASAPRAAAAASAPPPATAPADATLPTLSMKVPQAVEERGKETLQTTTSTIGKGTQDIRDIPQSLTVLTEKLIDDAKLDTLRQALHYTAGITFAATENGTDQDIRLRGFPVATTGDLLIDGMKDPSQYDRDSFNYDRIEVLRGSASMLFGRGSTGGVINQVNKQPFLNDASELNTTFGNAGYVRFTGDFNLRLGETAAVRLNVMNTGADNAGAKIDKQGIAPTVRWGIGSNDEWSVGLFYLHVDNVPMSNLRYLGGSVAGDIPARNFYGTASDYLRGEATYGTASWHRRFDGGGGELRTQLRSGRYKRSAWGTTAGYCSVALTATETCPAGAPALTPATLTPATRLTRSGLSPRQDDIEGTYFQSDYTNQFKGWGLTHSVTAGVDAAHETADRYSSYGAVGTNYNKGGTTVGTPNDGKFTAADPAYRKTSDYSGHALGAYAQDLLAVTPQWKVLGGIRYDRFKADMGQITYAANGTVATTPTSRLSYPSLWSYRGGLLYQPTDSQSYHLSYGTSFNTSADTYQYTTQQVADVPAEKSRNVELGAKLDWLDGALSTRAAIFRTEKYNERVTDSDFSGTYYTLSGKRHSQGFELDVVGRVTTQLEVYLSFSHISLAKIDKAGVTTSNTGVVTTVAGQPVGLSPKNSGAAWLSYQLTPAIRLAGGVRGASTNRPLQGATGAASVTARAPGYAACDAMAEYTFTDSIIGQVNVSNLTNKVYGDQLYPGFYTAGEARAVKVSLSARF